MPDSSSGHSRRVREPPQPLLIRPCSRWGLPGRRVSTPPVRSYRAISPLPQTTGSRNTVVGIRKKSAPTVFRLPASVFLAFVAVSFLWHFPSGRPARTLSGIVPYGARTFLSGACAPERPPDPLKPIDSTMSVGQRQTHPPNSFFRSSLSLCTSWIDWGSTFDSAVVKSVVGRASIRVMRPLHLHFDFVDFRIAVG